MRVTVYPTLDEVLYLHERLVARYGGAPGVRDLGLIESALARPRSGYYETLAEQAAALMQSLAINHAFVEGNERVAFAIAAVFVRLNGYRLRCEPDPAERFLIERVIIAGADLPEIAAWVERHISKTTD